MSALDIESSLHTQTEAQPEQTKNLPAEIGLWLFILGDMCIFALYFWVYSWSKSQQPALFLASQAQLNQILGAANTIILLTSSWFVASAIDAVRNNRLDIYRLYLKLTILSGLGFMGVKYVEYSEKFDAGIHIASNDFFMYYFTFTGFHLVHVVIGLSLLGYLLFSTRKTVCHSESLSPQHIKQIEGGGLYWHMVDLLWVILFSLIYLVP